jgi:hypothetical protein
MGMIDWARLTRKCFATGVDRDKGNGAWLRLVVTRTSHSGVDILSHRVFR